MLLFAGVDRSRRLRGPCTDEGVCSAEMNALFCFTPLRMQLATVSFAAKPSSRRATLQIMAVSDRDPDSLSPTLLKASPQGLQHQHQSRTQLSLRSSCQIFPDEHDDSVAADAALLSNAVNLLVGLGLHGEDSRGICELQSSPGHLLLLLDTKFPPSP